MLKKKLIVIGAGPGGYAAAFLAADLGIDTTLIDSEKNPGGVCLYRGCIPSKALLHSAKVISESEKAKEFGIEFQKPEINLNKLREWKDNTVNKLTGGLGQLCKQRKVNYLQGKAKILNNESIELVKENGDKEILNFENLIIATVSHPFIIPGMNM